MVGKSPEMPFFARYIGIDYSGAETPNASLKGLRIYLAEGDMSPVEVPPPPSPGLPPPLVPADPAAPET
jgi:hypothetical protein